jgi:hypothetical protein
MMLCGALALAGCTQQGGPRGTVDTETIPASGTTASEPGSRTGAEPVTTPRQTERNIYIDKVEMANPLVVGGRARTFENNVVLRARDAAGGTIAETFTTATGEMGTHSPFRGTVWLTRHPGDLIVIEALEYSAKDGSEQSLVRVERPFSLEAIEATFYFADANCTRVAPYRRQLPKSISLARLLTEALIAGPTADERKKGAVGAFPQGSAVQSVNLRGGVLTVDFNERLQNVGGSCAAQMIRASVTETLRALPTVDRVVITAGGSEPLALQP